MAGRIGYYGNIVKDGLVLDLDAGKRDSYGGTGTQWTDISGYGYNGVLTNGSTYSSANAGSIVFDGVDDYVSGSGSYPTQNVLSTNRITLETWVYHTSFASNKVQRYISTFTTSGQKEQAVIRTAGYIGLGSIQFYITYNNGGTYKFVDLTNQLVVNTWYHIVGTWDGTAQRVYKNSTLVGNVTPSAGVLTTSTNYYYIMSANGESIFGNMAMSRIYNRALSASEVLQNYNATKGRFGL